MVKFRLLSKEDRDAIHEASLEVLEKTGVKVSNDQALGILKEAGCSVDGNMVRMSPSLVQEALKKAPESFQLYTRDGSRQHTVGGSEVIYNPGSAAIYFIDRKTHEMRRANAADFRELVRLTDALEHIHAQSTAMVPADVPEIISDLYRLYVILRHSDKPIITGAFTKEGLLDMVGMLEAVVGGKEELRERPRAIFDCCPSSPLMWSDVTCQNLIDCAEHGIPAEIIPAPQMGATSPVTIAGTLVEANAEFLSGAVISQLVEPGTPIIYGGSPSAFDMRYTTARLGAVEAVMAACASAEMGKHYGVPTQGYLGLSDSKASEAGIENILVDTVVLDIPTLGLASKAIHHIKDVYGYPCGCGAHNAIASWKRLREKYSINAVTTVIGVTNALPVAVGADFVFYGPIKHADAVYPSVAMIDAAYSQLVMEKRIRIERDHPRYMIG
ncbi:hypothetical protein ES703_95098 [subsurface metagenome]